jgi:hypothetical protein
MAIDTTQLTDYSWSDIAKAAKTAMLTAAVGGSELRMPDGRFIKRLTVQEAKELYNTAISMVSAEAADGGGIALVEFGEQS